MFTGSTSENVRASASLGSLTAPLFSQPSHPPPSQRAHTTRSLATTVTVAPRSAQLGGTTMETLTCAPSARPTASRSTTVPSAFFGGPSRMAGKYRDFPLGPRQAHAPRRPSPISS